MAWGRDENGVRLKLKAKSCLHAEFGDEESRIGVKKVLVDVAVVFRPKRARGMSSCWVY
jgi:hypothetical protein